MKKSLLSILFLLKFGLLFAQDNGFHYSPSNMDSIESYLTKISNNKLTSFDSKKQKKIKEILHERKNSLLEEIKDSTFIFDKKIHSSVKRIVSEICHSNPQIDNDNLLFLISKSLIPNAASYGNGLFAINLGLFTQIENDDELAFIICHELAHEILKHNDKSIEEYVETFNSKDVKQKLKKATNQKYGRRSAVSLILKDVKYNFLKRSRIAETQADSLGYILFSKTKYNKEASLDVLKKLDLVDNTLFNSPTNLKQNFDFKEYPFKEIWVSEEKKLFDIKQSANDLNLNIDSLKTHPDIPIRIENLMRNFKITFTNSTKAEFSHLQKKAYENSIKIYFDDLKLDFALYQLLSLHEKDKIGEIEFNSAIAYLLKKLYILKEKHVFGKYVEGVNPFSEEIYINEIRLFLNNLELKNVRKIGLYFCLKNESKSNESPVFQDAFQFFKNLNPN